MYQVLLEELLKGSSNSNISEKFKANETLQFLTEVTDEDRKFGRNFSTRTKSSVFLTEAMKNELRCAICRGYLHVKSISYDHKVRKADGGMGNPANAQLSHPYCNSGYKEKLHRKSNRKK
jgi:hypothetical protein